MRCTLLILLLALMNAPAVPVLAQGPDIVDLISSMRNIRPNANGEQLAQIIRNVPILGKFTKSDSGAFRYGFALADSKAEDGSNQLIRFQAGLSKISTRPAAGVEMVIHW